MRHRGQGDLHTPKQPNDALPCNAQANTDKHSSNQSTHSELNALDEGIFIAVHGNKRVAIN